jgi:hypothetical protein
MTIPKTKQDIQISSKKQFLMTYSPQKLLNSSQSVKTYDEVFANKTPSIVVIKKEMGASFTNGYIKIWLVELNEMLNLRRPMTESQITFSAQLISDEFWMLHIADLQLLFTKILSGQYGELYESLNPPKIMTFFRNYLNERTSLGAEKSEREHQDYKQL